MSLEQPYNYVISDGIKYTQNEEEKIIRLLKDVRENICLLRPDLANQELDTVLEAIEKGEWNLQNLNIPGKELFDPIKQIEVNYHIDLSQAKEIIDNYRHFSEGGCRPCINLINFPKDMETCQYCKIGENEDSLKDTNVSNKSPKVQEFYKRGCDDRCPVLKRRLEEVLEGQN
jgi:hypothetical protein